MKNKRSKAWRRELKLSWGILIVILGLLNGGINAFFHAWQSAIFSTAFGLLLGKTLILISMFGIWKANKLSEAAREKE